MLDIIASYHCMQFQRKTNESKMEKNLALGLILVHLFFFKNLAPSVTRYYSQLSSCTISEKNNDPVLTKFSDGQKD